MFLAFYATVSAIAVWQDFLYFGDGAYFAFAIASGQSWELHFSELPRRIGALGLTGFPAWLAQIRGASHWWVGKIYQASFFAVPLWSLFLVGCFADKDKARWFRAWSVLCLATLGMSTFGFPTETWATLAFVWPALASVSSPLATWTRLICASLVAFIFLFSHEVAILCAPAFFISSLRSWRLAEGQAKVRLAILLSFYALLGLAWSYLWLAEQTKNPLLIEALRQNQATILPFHLLKVPAILLAIGLPISALFYSVLRDPQKPCGKTSFAFFSNGRECRTSRTLARTRETGFADCFNKYNYAGNSVWRAIRPIHGAIRNSSCVARTNNRSGVAEPPGDSRALDFTPRNSRVWHHYLVFFIRLDEI